MDNQIILEIDFLIIFKEVKKLLKIGFFNIIKIDSKINIIIYYD
jgi:hypothetical protein